MKRLTMSLDGKSKYPQKVNFPQMIYIYALQLLLESQQGIFKIVIRYAHMEEKCPSIAKEIMKGKK